MIQLMLVFDYKYKYIRRACHGPVPASIGAANRKLLPPGLAQGVDGRGQGGSEVGKVRRWGLGGGGREGETAGG
jgi:hypothetical protein